MLRTRAVDIVHHLAGRGRRLCRAAACLAGCLVWQWLVELETLRATAIAQYEAAFKASSKPSAVRKVVHRPRPRSTAAAPAAAEPLPATKGERRAAAARLLGKVSGTLHCIPHAHTPCITPTFHASRPRPRREACPRPCGRGCAGVLGACPRACTGRCTPQLAEDDAEVAVSCVRVI